ncbi:UbiA prenyltransferase family [Mycena vulgaris]|nr:UbiA prenyltransferase family [Mycena vulgaris]
MLSTWSDLKTILFPVTAFAMAATLAFSYHSIFCAVLWTWVHLLQANISNQCDSKNEDTINKPWRPLPSNRLTVAQARILRWLIVGVCQITSAFLGVNQASILLTITTLLHDDLNLSKHWIGKTICNSMGYLSFELGATQIVGGSTGLTTRCIAALVSSAAAIVLTIHAQDFADVNGDLKSGRVTLPIAYPRASRVYIFTVLPVLSIFLSLFWSSKSYITVPLVGLGLFVGGRYYWLREATDDARTFFLYNVRRWPAAPCVLNLVWLLSIHITPALVSMSAQ